MDVTLAQTDWPGITTAIVGIMGGAALLIGAISAAIVSIKTAKAVPRIENKIQETVHLALANKKTTDLINHAVNGKEPGEASMVKQVSEIHHETVHPGDTEQPMGEKVDEIHTEVVEAAAIIVADAMEDE